MKWYPVPDVEDTGKPFIKKIKIDDKGICVVGTEAKFMRCLQNVRMPDLI